MPSQMAFSFDMFDQPDAPPSVPLAPLVEAVLTATQTVTAKKVWQPRIAAEAALVASPVTFRLRDDMLKGLSSQTAKCDANLEAIRCLRALASQRRQATETEKAILARYAGWGGVPQAFANDERPEWLLRRQAVQAVLGEAVATARASTVNAHYTPLKLIDAIWEMVTKLGFKGGRILEPSAGAGHFLGRIPESVRGTSQVTAVELEPTTGAILSALYPEADVRVHGFEAFNGNKSAFDLVIGNVPFGDYRVSDPAYDAMRLRIHDYFIMKSCDLVREGGIVALITSTSTMDGHRAHKMRQWLNQNMHLVAACRFPEGTFAESANTQVVCDLIILQKTARKENPAFSEMALATQVAPSLGYSAQHIAGASEYWAQHRTHVLGEWYVGSGGQFGGRKLLVKKQGAFDTDLRRFVDGLPNDIMQAPKVRQPSVLPVSFDAATHGELRLNKFGALEQFDASEWVPIPAANRTRVNKMFTLSRIMRELLDEQLLPAANDDRLANLRSQLNDHYNDFVAHFGALSKLSNIRPVKNWSKLPLLLSLEHWDEEKQVAKKAAIFTTRTTRPPTRPERANDLPEALVIAFGETLSVDTGRIAELLGQRVEDVSEALESHGYAYFDPIEGKHVLAEEYLSGNVRDKLLTIRSYAATSARFERNRDALEKVQPVDLKPSEIMVQLGSPWVPVEVVEAYARSLMDNDQVQVTHSLATARWDVSGWCNEVPRTQYGTRRKGVDELLTDALNHVQPTVYDPTPDNKRVVNIIETHAAREKIEKLQATFVAWVWSDKQRETELVTLYNRLFNSDVPRKYSGKYFTFPDKSDLVSFRETQTDAIARGLLGGATGVFHKTGAGKTMILCAIAHESYRLGLSRKNLIVVQNSTLLQFAAEYLRVFPNANILVPDRDELSGVKRRALTAKMATGDWEAIIIAHSSLDRLPLGPNAYKTLSTYFMEPLDREIQLAGTQQVKRLETQRKKLETTLHSLKPREKDDGHLTFEDLGVESMLVDEAHRFKNLWYRTGRTRVAGMQQSSSRRALAMLAMAHHLYALHGRTFGLTLATATPITNTIAEIYTLQRYLQPHVLRRMGLTEFDAWAAMFGQVVSSIEVTPTGRGFRVHNRFARFHNVPELMRMYCTSVDIKTKEHFANVLKEPAIRGGKPMIVAAKCHPLQSAYIDTLVRRAEEVKEKNVDPCVDNMLKIVHDGRMVALDMRCTLSDGVDWEGSKVSLAVDNIFREWVDSESTRGTQAVFLDLSVPKPNGGWTVYTEMRDKLIAKGVPADEIAFMQFAETDRARLALFQKLQSGVVRIVFGSTERLGTGANIQNRLVAMHHMDVPWRPSDLEQRDGRGIRHGNMNEEVAIYRYVTESSFDAYMWQTAETKAKFILQVMDPDIKLRSVEDIGVATLSYAEVKAAASGDPTVMEKIAIDSELAKLQLSYSAFKSKQRNDARQLNNAKRSLTHNIGKQANMVAANDAVGNWEAQRVELSCFKGQSVDFKHLSDAQKQALTAWVLQTRVAADRNLYLSEVVGSIGPMSLRRSREGRWLGEINGVTFALGEANTAVGFTRLLASVGASVAESIELLQRDIDRQSASIPHLEALLTAPWEHEARFDELTRRAEEVNKLLELSANENTVGITEEDGKETDAASAEETDEELADA